MFCKAIRPQAILLALLFPLQAQEKVDLDIIHRIKTEAIDNSKVMETLSDLSDVHGGRLTGSPEYRKAAEWAKKRLEGFGAQNVHFEAWGPFGRSWSVREHSLEMMEPAYARLTAAPLAWAASSEGPVTAEVIHAPLDDPWQAMNPTLYQEALDKFRKEWTGKLRGKIVLISRVKNLSDATNPAFTRYTDAELAELASAPTPMAKMVIDPAHFVVPENPEERKQFLSNLPDPLLNAIYDQLDAIDAQRNQFLKAEGAVAVIVTDAHSRTGNICAMYAGPWQAKVPLAPPMFAVTQEEYGRMVRLLEKKLAVRVRVNLKVEAGEKDVDGFNVIGEIPGAKKTDEVVMIGGHFDSFHAGTGATDNGAGSAVMMEVIRILKTLNLKMERTVRIGLWDGEEQGLFGSLGYTKAHFGDPKTMKLSKEHGKLSGYFNFDNGSGKIRGVYLQGNDAMRPVFAAWLEPFADMGARTITLRNIGSTDHVSFDALGLPSFQFIQDELDYTSTTHHTTMDTYEHCRPEDLMQASAIIASIVYHAANRPELLPRKVLPKPMGKP